MDAFYGLEHVRRIDLSNNELEFIPPGLFGTLQQKELKEINLSRNKLTSLPLDFFKMLRAPNKQSQLATIRLDGNPWDCTCSMTTWNPQLVSWATRCCNFCTRKVIRIWLETGEQIKRDSAALLDAEKAPKLGSVLRIAQRWLAVQDSEEEAPEEIFNGEALFWR